MIRRPTGATRTHTPLPATTRFRTARRMPRGDLPQDRDRHQRASRSADRIVSADPVETVWQGKFIATKRQGKWEYAARARGIQAAVILAIDAGDVILVEQYRVPLRSEEHTSELQSLMRISYAVFCLNKKNSVKLYRAPRS